MDSMFAISASWNLLVWHVKVHTNNTHAAEDLEEHLQNSVFNFTSTASTCSERVCVCDASASRRKPLTAPTYAVRKNLILNTVNWTKTRRNCAHGKLEQWPPLCYLPSGEAIWVMSDASCKKRKGKKKQCPYESVYRFTVQQPLIKTTHLKSTVAFKTKVSDVRNIQKRQILCTYLRYHRLYVNGHKRIVRLPRKFRLHATRREIPRVSGALSPHAVQR